MDQDKIKQEAKQIMDNFMDSLKDIEVEEDFVLRREACLREEGNGSDLDLEFKNRFLKNAPKLSGDAILASKAAWEN